MTIPWINSIGDIVGVLSILTIIIGSSITVFKYGVTNPLKDSINHLSEQIRGMAKENREIQIENSKNFKEINHDLHDKEIRLTKIETLHNIKEK